jgi:hypothetical protein
LGAEQPPGLQVIVERAQIQEGERKSQTARHADELAAGHPTLSAELEPPHDHQVEGRLVEEKAQGRFTTFRGDGLKAVLV